MKNKLQIRYQNPAKQRIPIQTQLSIRIEYKQEVNEQVQHEK